MDTHAFQDKLRNLLAWFLDVRSGLLDKEGAHRVREMADHIACDYRQLGVSRIHTKKIVKISKPVSKEYFTRDRKYREPLKKLYARVNGDLGKYITHFYLHGSLATEDYKKGWSDLDTFMVIKKEVVRDPRKLMELRKICFSAWQLFLKITPLQHHGFLIATEFDLESYPSHVMPPEVFDEALSMKGGQSPLRLSLRKEHNRALELLRHRLRLAESSLKTGIFKYHPKDGVYLLSGFRNADNNMHQLMSFLGNGANAPIYFLNALGQSCYKRDSFQRAKPYFSKRGWNLIDKATKIRGLWPEKEGLRYRGNKIPFWVQKILGKNYFEENVFLFKEAVEKAHGKKTR